jgi:cytochrome c oxidase subunit 2
VNRNIVVRLHAVDVIHSFWVPRLAGKTDVIPGRTNHMWFNATETGNFSGQCAEFCGIGHSDMRFSVTSESNDDFQAWLTAQAAAQPPADEPKLAFQGD